MGIGEGSLSREDELIYRERFNRCSTEYLRGYVDSYQKNRGLIRRFLEDVLLMVEPLTIRAAERAYKIKVLGA